MLVHEIGHLLGLDHTANTSTSSVMDESDVFNLDAPTTYDKNNLINKY